MGSCHTVDLEIPLTLSRTPIPVSEFGEVRGVYTGLYGYLGHIMTYSLILSNRNFSSLNSTIQCRNFRPRF